MAPKIDYKQISKTNFKVLKTILEDDSITLSGITQTIKIVFNKDTISELVYLLLEHNKELCNEIEGWDLKAIGSK